MRVVVSYFLTFVFLVYSSWAVGNESPVTQLRQQAKLAEQIHNQWQHALKNDNQDAGHYKAQFSKQLKHQQALWLQLARQLAEQEYQQYLSPQSSTITHQEYCRKIQSESECRKSAIENAKIALAATGGAVYVAEQSQLTSQRFKDTAREISVSERFEHEVKLDANNAILQFKLLRNELKKNQVTGQKSVEVEISGVVAGKKQNDVLTNLVKQHKNKLAQYLYHPPFLSNGLIKTDYVDDLPIELAYVGGGSFVFGSNSGDKVEQPISKQQVDGFYLMTQEVSNQLYLKCIEALSCNKLNNLDTNNFAVTNVSYWHVTQQFIPWLNAKTNNDYRLPTEQEWEYAAKLNQDVLNNCSMANLPEYCGKSREVSGGHVGKIGLYNLSGNVAEWVDSCWTLNHRINTTPNCNKKVTKGGSWYDSTYNRRPSARFGRSNTAQLDTLGFRLVLSYTQQQ